MGLFLLNKRRLKHAFSSFILSCVVMSCANTQSYAISGEKRYILQNVNIVDVVTGDVKKAHQVYVEDGIIQQISASNIQKPRVQIIDAKGGFLLPGLIDMHVHAYDKSAFELALSHGVTHVRIMNGIPNHLHWRQQQKEGSWLASSLTVSTPIVHSHIEPPLSWTANNGEEARRLVQNAKALGYDLIKAYGSMDKVSLSAMIDEANALNIPIAKHGPHPPTGLSWEALANMQSLEHVEDIYQGILGHSHDETLIPSAIEKVSQVGVPITPTLNIFWQLTKISELKNAFVDSLPAGYISPFIAFYQKQSQVKRWLNSQDEMVAYNIKTLSFLKKITKQLALSNVPLLVGSDAGVLLSPHGLATINEMMLLQSAGLSNIEVIRAATINAANALALDSKLGVIDEGLQADFILLEDNPLKDLTTLNNVIAVSKEGKWLGKEQLLALRENARNNHNVFSEMWTLFSN